MDETAAMVGLYYIDACPGSSVLDLKPYTPNIGLLAEQLVVRACLLKRGNRLVRPLGKYEIPRVAKVGIRPRMCKLAA